METNNDKAAPAVDAEKLPPLPEPWITNTGTKDPAARHHYAEDQMVDYANAAAADLRALVAQQAARIEELEIVAHAAIAYDAAIHSCADDPKKMSSFCSAQGDDLDMLYANWIEPARAAIAKTNKEGK